MNQQQYLSDKALASRWDVHRGTTWEWANQGRIPKPIKLGPRFTRWRLSDILEWEAAQEAKGEAQ